MCLPWKTTTRIHIAADNDSISTGIIGMQMMYTLPI